MQSITIKDKIAYLILILLGISTILYQINFEDLWLDELNSFWVADPNLSYSETLTRHNKSDFHNPILFNLVLKYFFKIVGYNPDVARYLTLFFGSISLIFIGLISYQEKKNNCYLFTTFLACVSIYIIKYSQELRPYSLLLLTSSLNIYFFLRILNNSLKKLADNTLFVVFSVINYSVNPFSLIIFFSQIIYLFFRRFLFKTDYKKFLVVYTTILIIYFLFNFKYILYQVSFESYMLSSDIKNVLDGFYFPRFFGSKIMGYLYLILLIFLIIRNRKIFLLKENNYTFFLILIFLSYLVPLVYGVIRTPVLHDRYIIFILIPIFVLIPFLIKEISNNKIKIFLITFLVTMTLLNQYLEVFKRVITKPEFKKTLNYVRKNNINVFVIDLGSTSFLFLNYIKNINNNEFSKFTFVENNDLEYRSKDFWLICYSTDPNFECVPKNVDNHRLVDSKKNLYVEAKLYLVN